ncbi:Thaumatin family - like 10 [Theobroma cacao]|nr:Thaumatin family - like 10 [Theobroma cacao]
MEAQVIFGISLAVIFFVSGAKSATFTLNNNCPFTVWPGILTSNFSTPDTCPPTNYSNIFKSLCPQAYSYAYDDKSGLATCTGGANYLITFCP